MVSKVKYLSLDSGPTLNETKELPVPSGVFGLQFPSEQATRQNLRLETCIAEIEVSK
jgi:hypothetical protein